MGSCKGSYTGSRRVQGLGFRGFMDLGGLGVVGFGDDGLVSGFS